ncbi:MAG: phage holin family protein [Clostridiales bacterium]|nr:phage holin family protein [Clostridiales bacterium]
MDKLKAYLPQGLLATSIATFTARLGILGWVLIALLVCMIIDFLSGMAASAKESLDHPDDKNYGWSSKKGKAGILKKFGYVLVVAAAIILDFIIYKTAGYLNFDMPTSTFFGLVVSVLFILNELLSITENAGRMGAPVPNFLKKTIAVLKNKVEEGDKDD